MSLVMLLLADDSTTGGGGGGGGGGSPPGPTGPPTSLESQIIGGIYRVTFLVGDAAAYTRCYNLGALVGSAYPGDTYIDLPYPYLLGGASKTFDFTHFRNGQESAQAHITIADIGDIE